MSTVNKHILLGNLGKDPDIRQNGNGQLFGRFSVATSESWKTQDGHFQQRTDWHTVIVNGYLAEKAKKLKKGEKVYIEGRSRQRKWVNDQGVAQLVTEVHADTLIPQGLPSQQQPKEQYQQPKSKQQQQRQPVSQNQDWMDNPSF